MCSSWNVCFSVCSYHCIALALPFFTKNVLTAAVSIWQLRRKALVLISRIFSPRSGHAIYRWHGRSNQTQRYRSMVILAHRIKCKYVRKFVDVTSLDR